MTKSYRYAKDGSRIVVRLGAIVSAALFSFEAHAWMEGWAPAFKCSPADVETLSFEIHDWEWKKLRPISEERIVRFGAPYEGAPKNCELLYECGWLALFAGETEEDAAHKGRKSLFVRLRMEEGTELWRLVLTTGSSWKVGKSLNSWSQNMVGLLREDFCVRRACPSMDGRAIWLVCNPHTDMYNIVCRFDLDEKTFKVLIDGNEAEEQVDGTILVKDKKVYLQDENGEPDGAALCDVWITPEGKVVKKTKPVRLLN